MPRYFFHVHDGRDEFDVEGSILPDIATARREAVALAGALILDKAEKIAVGEDWHLEVTDEHGLLFFRIDFVLSEAPAGSLRSAGS